MKRLFLLLLILTACEMPVPTAPPISTETHTPIPSATLTATSSPSPTITNTPLPTWTPAQINMYHSPTEQAIWRLDNPHHYCFLSYFDLTLEPGYIGVWKRDQGGYLLCEARIAPKGSQP